MASFLSWFGFSGSRKTARRRSVHQAKLVLEVLESRLAPSATDVLQYHNDASSDGQNLNETILTPANVNSTSFGKLFSTAVDGQVYAQPLFVSGVDITTGSHQGPNQNVVYVATEHDSLYAINGDTGTVLWKDSFLTHGLAHATSITPIPSADLYGPNVGGQDISPQVGITSTPVIFSSTPGTGTLYLVASTREIVGGVRHYVQRLYAIDIQDGSEAKTPYIIGDATPTTISTTDNFIYVYGTGAGSVTDPYNNTGNPVIQFNAMIQNPRSGLSLSPDGKTVYAAWASYGDNGPYHGWVVGFNIKTPTLQLDGVFNTTPNAIPLTSDPGSQGGIWQGGGSVAVDSGGDLYFMTGNGTFDTNLNGGSFPTLADYGDSILRLTADLSTSPTNQNTNGWGLMVKDYFTPSDQGTLAGSDTDLGSGGVLLLPDSAGNPTHPHLLVGAGKEGIIYLIDRDNMGKYHTTDTGHVVQETPGLVQNAGSYDTPAYFNGSFYYAGQNDNLKQFTISNASFSLGSLPDSVSADNYQYPGHGATPSISADGTSNGIVWTLDHGTNELRAYDATNLLNNHNEPMSVNDLYTSAQASNNRDNPGTLIKFSVPTVTNGHVYVGTSNHLVVYGLLQPVPILINAGGGATGSFVADSHYSGGSTGHVTQAINLNGYTDVPQSVFQSYRSGSSFSYTLSNLVPNAAYVVQLDFAEISATAAGQRVLDVSINNTPVPSLTNFDIFVAAGNAEFKAVEEQVATTADSTGKITIKLTRAPGSSRSALVSGVEVLP